MWLDLRSCWAFSVEMFLLRVAALLIWISLPFGIALAATLEDVRSSGVLQCGVDADAKGFSQKDVQGQWQGLNVDYCRGLAAAIIGDPRKVNFTGLASDERIEALQSGEIDILVSTLKVGAVLELKDGLLAVAPIYIVESGGTIVSYAPIVRQGDDQWFAVAQWTRHALVLAADRQNQGKIAASLDALQVVGLEPGWCTRIIAAVQDIVQMMNRSGLDGPQNTMISQGGLLWAPQP
jgi:Bacterial extracellular solute-binding proteins, family 3